jgi:hypothetical protein
MSRMNMPITYTVHDARHVKTESQTENQVVTLKRYIFICFLFESYWRTLRLQRAQKAVLFLSHLDRDGLYAQSHDRVDDVVVVLLEGLDGLLPRDTGLLHNKLNVLGLESRVIDLLAVILLLLIFLLLLDGLALVVTVVVVMVVTSVVVGLSLGLGELLSGGSLSLGVQVLDLGLAEDAGAGSVGAACH